MDNQATDGKSIPRHVPSTTVSIILAGAPASWKSPILNHIIVPALQKRNLNFMQNEEDVLSVHLSADDLDVVRGATWRPAPGDLVELKSGGCAMTVVSTYGCGSEDVAVIFDVGKGPEEKEIPLACLKAHAPGIPF